MIIFLLFLNFLRLYFYSIGLQGIISSFYLKLVIFCYNKGEALMLTPPIQSDMRREFSLLNEG